MTRAAFLFSGQLRGFKHGINSLVDNLFSAFDEYDTFFYTPQEDGKELLEFITPSACIIEKDQYHRDIENFDNGIAYSDAKIQSNGYELKGRLQHFYLQWYGVKRVYELFESYNLINGLEYDVVFRLRSDFMFFDKFTYEYFEGLQIPNFADHYGIYDRMAFGSPKYMKYYCSLYDNLYEGKYNIRVSNGNSESKLMQHLHAENIPIKRVDLNYKRINRDGTFQSSDESH